MAKYTAPIDEDTRQRILGLPRGIHFAEFMRKAIDVFVEELEKNPELLPENFVITVTARKDGSKRNKYRLRKVRGIIASYPLWNIRSNDMKKTEF